MSRKKADIAIHSHSVSLERDPERIRGIHRGELIHQALYFLDGGSDEADCRRAVDKAFAFMDLDTSYWNLNDDFVAPLVRALSLPEVRPWFETGVGALREVEAIDAEGIVHRMDRVVIRADSICIIDFKVGQRDPEHVDQVLRYVALARDIFDRPVTGYVLYIDEPGVLEVP
jgi:hypothetical protein